MIFLTLINQVKNLIGRLTPWNLVSLLPLLVMVHTSTVQAVVVQNGRGLVGVINNNYSTTFTGKSRYWAEGRERYVFLSWYAKAASCGANSTIMEIDGVRGIKFNSAGTLMLVPDVTFIDNRSWATSTKNYSDTVSGVFNGYGSNTSENFGAATGCLWKPYQSTPATSVNLYITHQVTATGRMLIYGTGQQVSGTATLSDAIKLGITDPSGSPGGYAYSNIMSAGSYSIVVSDLGCTLSTPTLIDFGPQPANSVANEELASRTNNLSVTCSQTKNPIGATLSLVTGINPIYYSGNEYEINLLKNGSGAAGAYVKMSIDVNGAVTPVAFNRQFINIGSITSAQNAVSFNHPVTYTLYSRGTGMTGKVSGSSELSIVLR